VVFMLVKDFSPFFTFSSGQVLNFIGEFKQKPIGISFATTRGIFDVRFSEVDKHVFEIDYDYRGDYSEKEAEKEVRKMLGLDSDMKEIYSKIGTDAFMKKAIKSFYGMRLTQIDPWITSVSFIISQFNNIKNIRNSVQKIMKKFGEREGDAYLFPTYEHIAKASKSDLMSCGIGYRYAYLHEFANACLDGKINLNSLYSKTYDEAKQELMKFKGIGDKVADCILLFGCGKGEAFPIDVWIKRIVEHVYFHNRKVKISEIHTFASQRFGNLAGYAQQYMFQYARTYTRSD